MIGHQDGEGAPAPELRPLKAGALSLELSLNERQLQQFASYLKLLLAWNKRINLTRITEPPKVQVRHFLDSLSCATVTGDLSTLQVIDVGTGAGFPGLPLKILFPGMLLTLVDSAGKKTQFLQAVADELELTGLTIRAERAEDLGRQEEHRARYDWALARGVAAMPVLAEYLLPLCKQGGHMLAMKGERAEEETRAAMGAIRVLGGGFPKIHEVKLPDRGIKHHLVIVPKVATTPARYPRRPGIPAKRPIEGS